MTAPVLAGATTTTFRQDPVSIDISHVIYAISRKDYISILESSDFFWLAFCSLYKTYDRHFSVLFEGENITITGTSHVIDSIKKTIEELRVYCLKGRKEYRNISLSGIKFSSCIFIRETQEVIDLKNWLLDSCPNIENSWFLDYISPFLGDLCKLIGAELMQSTGTQKVEEHDGIHTYTSRVLEIKWVNPDCFAYPIAPLKIASRLEGSKAVYALYQTQTLCNLTFIAADGEVHAHTFPMLLDGGEFIKATLTVPMREGATKRIEFPGFTIDVLKGYIDFVYLGEEAFKPEAFFSSGRNVFELLRFAHMYGILPLIDVCTNLISLVAKREDVGRLRELAIRYENRHLAKLCDYLSSSSSMMAFPKVDVPYVIDAISRKDYISILRSPESFWLAFCSVCKVEDGYFSATFKESNISIRGISGVIDSIQKTIEELRLYCLQGYKEDRGISLSGITIGCSIFIRETQEVIDLKNWLSDSCRKIEKSWFLDYISPFLGDLCKLIGAELMQSKGTQKVEDDDGINTYTSLVLEIKWAVSDHFVYPIKPLKVATRLEDLKGYIDFVYLGEEAFKPETFFASGRNVFELLRFAHMYGVLPLIDGCTNLISLVAKPEDAGSLRDLAAHYGNAHLVRLCDYLSPGASMMAFPKV